MEAIIYAAGVGQRLKRVFGDTPKILLEFHGCTLLEWHLRRLIENGVTTLSVVTGYQREKVDRAIGACLERYPIQIRQLVNEAFTEGSVLSFAASLPVLEAATSPLLLMDSDVLYPGSMLGRLRESRHPTALLVDRNYATTDDDPVLVPISDGRPFDFVKRWRGQADQVGESVGFFKIAPKDMPLLIEETKKRLDGPGRQDSYDEVLRALVRAGRFGYEDVTGFPWTEIDFPEDVERAVREVLPALEQFEGGKRVSGTDTFSMRNPG